MSRNKFRPAPLAEHFMAPEDYYGSFGWICGFSADAEFLNTAADLFTGQSKRARACEGGIALAVMLDPGGPQISLAEAPGVLHMPLRTAHLPFRLMHAKVAILGFRHKRLADQWVLRLVVSTGNWTRQTVEESLDLVWRIDVESRDLQKQADEDVRQRCSDFAAAWDMLRWLQGHYDHRALEFTKQPFPNTIDAVESWLRQTTAGRKSLPQPRFMDSRKASFLDQLPARVATIGGGQKKRNCLVMASGFFEEAGKIGAVPAVLDRIVHRLKDAGHLTILPWIGVIVNPLACQAVAGASEAIAKEGWTVLKPGKPDCFDKRHPGHLHAKFIFSANHRSESNNCTSAWLYLGSGNLTPPGFIERMDATKGNLEAGVVIAPEGLKWQSDGCDKPEDAVTNRLPIDWGSEITTTTELQSGAGMPERNPPFMGAPVACLRWEARAAGPGGWLAPLGEVVELAQAFDVIDAGNPCKRDVDGRFIWPNGQPRQVPVRWRDSGGEHKILVPVGDASGRLAVGELPPIDMEDALLQLGAFPIAPLDDEPQSDENGDLTYGGSQQASGQRSLAGGPRNYAIRDMMRLVEVIAARQTVLEKADWARWCTRLESILGQIAENSIISAFRQMEVNPLGPLWHAPFRPAFAETAASEEGARYEAVLDRIEIIWKLRGLARLGGQHASKI
ncbi:hypothetical protein [Aminobacter aminovorans]|uniref:hypothetical protein n=1 Tax=Aminobacter aminovorans TaxID=83263 RepID=UPI00286423EB|nr:hypothetical protein [Aminobacter aminovorans]MDR7225227.1 hypothetical protein [Aminobacter aminovorans]